MIKTIGFLILIATMACSQPVKLDNSTAEKKDIKSDCENSVSFGDIEICLPIIKGMTECYSLPIVKSIADEYNYEGNTILAYYLNNEAYEQVSYLDEMSYDDYFQIYATNELKGIKVGESDLKEMAMMIDNQYIKQNWYDLKKKFEERLNNFSLREPVIIDSYSINRKSRTYIMMMSHQIDHYDETLLLMISNIVLIKDRFVWLAYYKEFDGEKSIEKAKTKNEFIVLKLMFENN